MFLRSEVPLQSRRQPAEVPLHAGDGRGDVADAAAARLRTGATLYAVDSLCVSCWLRIEAAYRGTP